MFFHCFHPKFSVTNPLFSLIITLVEHLTLASFFPFSILSLLSQGGAITGDKGAFLASKIQANGAVSNVCPSCQYAS